MYACTKLRAALDEEPFRDLPSNEDKQKIVAAVIEAEEWLDKNQRAKKYDFEARREHLDSVVNPIIDHGHVPPLNA